MIRKKSRFLFLRILSAVIVAVLIIYLFENNLSSKIVYAAETGTTYIASTQAYYVHPVTGEVADSGNNEAIGQPMTENITNSKALIEQTDSGSMYATLRLSMMDNISNVRFSTQEWGGSGWSASSNTIMQENVGGDYTSDFRFLIPNESVVIKVEFYVTPMGRDIAYFVIFTGFEEGSSDFIVSIDNSGSTTDTTTQEETDTSAESTQTQTVTAGAALTAGTTSSNQNTQQTTIPQTGTNNTGLSQNVDSKNKTAEQLIEEADGLVLSDESLLETAQTEENTKNEEVEKSQAIPALPWLLVFQCIIILTVPGTVLGVILLLIITIQRKRERDNE